MAGNLGMEDLRKQAQIMTVRRNDNGHADPDPIQEAIRVRKQLVGNRIMEQAVAESETEAIKADNERLKAEIEREQLQEQKQSRSASDKWVEYILEEQKRLQERLAETERALSQQQAEALQERLSLLQAEIERLQQQPSQPQSSMEMARNAVAEARALIEALGPTQSTPPPPITNDPALEAWTLRANLDQERWRVTTELQHQEKLAEIQARNAIEKQRLEMEREHYNKVDRFLTDTAPRVIEIFGPLIQKIIVATPGPVAAPGAMAQAVAPPAPNVPVLKCAQCQGVTFFASPQGALICSTCGAEYKFNGEAQPEPPTEEDKQPEGTYIPPKRDLGIA